MAKHKWLCYSTKLDGAFCLPCTLFNGVLTDMKVSGVLVTKPFRAWQKKSEKLGNHEKTKYHQACLELADQLIRAANIANNRAILKSVACAILFCGKQCIALRGDADRLDTPGNPGNFLALLQLLATTDHMLHSHLESPAMRCVTHMSPQTQNELIEIMGKHIFLRGIVEELKEAKYFAILADEVTSHNVEHLAICVRFVDCHNNICKEFLVFIALERS